MKTKKHFFYSFFQNFILIITAFLCLNMTGGTEKGTTPIEPKYVEPKENVGNFIGEIHDDKNIIKVDHITFTGHGEIGGIRKEDDDSVNRIELSKIKELKIVQALYVSTKYSDKEYILADAIANNNAIIKDLLIPRHVVICAIAAETKMEKAWFLYKISKIVIYKETKQEVIEIEEIEKKATVEKGIFGRIKEGIKTISEKINISFRA